MKFTTALQITRGCVREREHRPYMFVIDLVNYFFNFFIDYIDIFNIFIEFSMKWFDFEWITDTLKKRLVAKMRVTP